MHVSVQDIEQYIECNLIARDLSEQNISCSISLQNDHRNGLNNQKVDVLITGQEDCILEEFQDMGGTLLFLQDYRKQHIHRS